MPCELNMGTSLNSESIIGSILPEIMCYTALDLIQKRDEVGFLKVGWVGCHLQQYLINVRPLSTLSHVHILVG